MVVVVSMQRIAVVLVSIVVVVIPIYRLAAESAAETVEAVARVLDVGVFRAGTFFAMLPRQLFDFLSKFC